MDSPLLDRCGYNNNMAGDTGHTEVFQSQKGSSAVVLAGGSNRRFPIVKALMRVDNQRLIERTTGILKELFRDVLISTNTPEHFFYLGLPMIGDLYRGAGPLSGIFSSLLNITTEWLFVVASDMPFIKKTVIEYIINVPTDAQVVVCEAGGTIHPLFGLYHRSLIGEIGDLLTQGRVQMLEFLGKVRCHIIPEEEIKKIDPDLKNFVNINTLEEYKKQIGGQPCLD